MLGALGAAGAGCSPGLPLAAGLGSALLGGGTRTVAVKAASREGGTPAILFVGGVGGATSSSHLPGSTGAGKGARESAGISSVTLLLACPQPKQKGFGGGLGRCIHRAAACLVPGLSVTCGGRGARARAEPLSVCCSSLRRAGAKCHLWHAAVVPKPGLLLSGYGLGLL